MENPVEKIPFAITRRKILLRSAMLTTALVASMTLIAVWASKRGYDFDVLSLNLFGAMGTFLIWNYLQIWLKYEMGKMIYSCCGSIIYCGYVMYATNFLMKGHNNIFGAWFFVQIVLGLYFTLVNFFLEAES